MAEHFHTPAAVAELLGFAKVDAVYRLIAGGGLVGTNVGTGRRAVWRIAQSDLGAFLRSRRSTPAVTNTPRPVRRRERRKVVRYF